MHAFHRFGEAKMPSAAVHAIEQLTAYSIKTDSDATRTIVRITCVSSRRCRMTKNGLTRLPN